MDKYRDQIEQQVRFNLTMGPADITDAVLPILERALAEQRDRVLAIPRWEDPDTGITYVEADALEIALEGAP